MCGRFYHFSSGAAVADLFGLAGVVEVAPSQPVSVVRLPPVGSENLVGRQDRRQKGR